MYINEVAKLTNLSTKAIRFYEQKGLIAPPDRSVNGYRQYNMQHIEALNLIREAREIGFSLPECEQLLALYRNPHRRSADVKAQTLAKIDEIDAQIAKLQQMRTKLSALAAQCPGDDSENCPIINSLSGQCCCHNA
ncbi:DNA-binding transcriptional regulator CueR [Gallibacterium anatis UMN179]|uniref:HTH-type transcriptional regulator CueR n=1 Tax=Gallibacterium anatis (strain UMN179) TaxID=1005058 RepID=F4HDA8_GALAU|nr:Cu(I)-responsive transcriptional regulator [Gallibacterium anatis]AEC16646.1 DNA-binding transcriptional regulator CueR [Gallibacterium anatis UMN179]